MAVSEPQLSMFPIHQVSVAIGRSREPHNDADGDLGLLVSPGLSGHPKEAQAEAQAKENTRSSGYGCLLLFLSFLPLLAVHATPTPTHHPPPWPGMCSLESTQVPALCL